MHIILPFSYIKQILVLFILTLTLCKGINGKSSLDYSNKIEPKLLQTFQARQNVIVVFTTDTQDVLDAIADTRYETRGDLLNALNFALEENSRQTQANVTAFLDQVPGIRYETLWITNELFLFEVDYSTIDRVANFREVRSIIEDPRYSISVMDPNPSEVVFGRNNNSTWGVDKIQAPEANDFLNGLSNSGQINISSIRVGTIDTGVRWTHEALRNNYLGDYGWYDPDEKTTEAYDNIGHGTHVTGTIVGDLGFGVYNNAKWMACKGCKTMSCQYSSLTACAQFMICPTTPDGLTKNCTLAPHVVSNSWSGFRGNPLFDLMIRAFHVAKIIPLFSIGNEFNCGTAKSPGDRNVIGVGATSSDDAISFFSSKGPSVDGKIKPDVVAPGSAVLSSYHTADDAYLALSGTSMACPHAAGVTSMLLAYKEDLLFDDIRSLLSDGAEREALQWDGTVCEEGDAGDVFPNNIFGHGRINALRSLQILHEAEGKLR